MRIDIHTHAFHPKVAHKVVEQLEGHYGISPVGTGTMDDLLARVRRAKFDKVVVFSAATDPSQVIPANSWAIELQKEHPEVVAFGTMHPGFVDMDKEFARLERGGIRGLKFHPDFQGFFLDDPRFLRVMEAARGRFAVIFHVGDKLPPEQNPSCPFKMARLLDRFPETTMIAAHMGGFMHWKWALDQLVGRDVYFDTSSTLDFIPDDLLFEIFERHPRERILFGSDYPLFDPGEEAKKLKARLRLSDDELEEILGAGARLLGLE
ncbi:amidohydrolase 2 [Desulfovibrio sp. X2]|uniref:amidohydrolase family protein n=1 Tax=Desulfovibrio sp. X2 TaxID=941449 RepID=UPI0003588131|nr:amidohydrolase family protein [Desulfovibrio sp. X2]EPR38670.1 amidohydrolase 2 [Desulfovibrio sp. X2]